jgi:carnitine-CoA ligase
MNIIAGRGLRGELERHVQKNPEKTWLVYEDAEGQVTRHTYREFDSWVNRTANMLLQLGVRKRDKVNLHLPNRPEFLFLWFGLAKIGAVMVPSNPISTAEEMTYLLSHSEATLSFTMAGHLAALQAAQAACPQLREVVLCGPRAMGDARHFDDLIRDQPSELLSRPPLAPLDEAAILYTSGTTAKPKGVLVTHANYIWVGEVVSQGMRLGPDDRHLVVMPYFHGNAQYYSTMGALVVGASIAVMHRFSASRYFEQALRHETTVSSIFAAPIRMIVNQPPKSTDRGHQMRLIIYAQNVTEAQLGEWDQRFGAPLMQIYGMTETIGLPLMNPLDGPRNNMSMGRVTLPYECKVVDEAGRDLPSRVVGQLAVRGEPGCSLMKGYYKNPPATAETLRDGWLYTGDNVYMDENGYFFFVDRAKDMIKRAGENVSAAEVEGVLNQHPAVFESAVVGVPDPIRDEAVMAIVILKPGITVTAQELIAFCAERLATFKVPQLIEFREEFPRTSVGKVQKHILRRDARAATVATLAIS